MRTPDISLQLLHSFTPLSETSLNPHETTIYKIRSRQHKSLYNNFSLFVNCLLYAPGEGVPITCSDENGKFHKIYQMMFGKGYRMAGFILYNTGAINSKTITLTHAPCQRRIVTCDQLINLHKVDKVTIQHSKMGGTKINSGILNSDAEMIYGILGLGGNFKNLNISKDYYSIQETGSRIDPTDAYFKTFYKHNDNESTIHKLVGNAVGTFNWGSVLVGLKAKP